MFCLGVYSKYYLFVRSTEVHLPSVILTIFVGPKVQFARSRLEPRRLCDRHTGTNHCKGYSLEDKGVVFYPIMIDEVSQNSRILTLLCTFHVITLLHSFYRHRTVLGLFTIKGKEKSQ